MPQNNYTVKVAAERLHLSTRALLHRIKAGTVQAEKVDPDSQTSAYLIPAQEVERLEAESAAESTLTTRSRAQF